MPVFFEEEGNMKNYRIKKNFRALAAVLGLSLVWGSAASAEPSADNGAKVEVSIVQNGGLLYDENRYEGKTPVPDGVNALADLPEKYDLRDEGRVTDVKFQNPWGACWAFGPIASLESNAITRERKILIIQKRLWYGSQRMSVKMRMPRILNWRGYLLRMAIQKSMSIT